MRHVFSNLWQGLVPPRVEMLAWFAMTKGLSTKDLLRKRNIIPSGDINCKICNKEEEINKIIFENTTTTWKSACEQMKALTGFWSEEKSSQTKLGYAGQGSVEVMDRKYLWRQCNIFKPDASKYTAVQFLIEDVEVREEEVAMVVESKELVEWIKGKEDTN
ncbi:hypothetical protein PIB30_079157 [Stylosanthes scabra]|uniref:Reverse transcriptase zinc-binding domain-containing protein n=1 Tax=Stylosanthes scabra TaxID=79078 RepID=A0ABU6XP18_9FABA|nr:hypothetical protein [Stylosanthes scabra]